MDIDFALGAYLATRSTVVTAFGTQIWGDKAPQKTTTGTKVLPPWVTYEQVGGEKFYHSRGASNLAEADITITVKGASYVKAKDLYEILRNELDGFSGMWSTVEIRSAFLSEPANISQPDTVGSDASDYGVRGALTVTYARAVPTFAGAP